MPCAAQERRRVDRAGPTGEDDPLGPALSQASTENVRQQLGVHAALAHATGDQLGVLTAEVEDQHFLRRSGGPRRAAGDAGFDSGVAWERQDRPGPLVATAAATGAEVPTRRSQQRARWNPCRPTARAAAACPRSAATERPSPRRDGIRRCPRSQLVAIDVRRPPIRLNVPSFSLAGPSSDLLESCRSARCDTRAPRGSDGWNVAIPQWKPRPGAS